MPCLLCGSQEATTLPKVDAKTTITCGTCGRYTVTDLFIAARQIDEKQEQRYLLSALTRQASDVGNPLTLTTQNLKSLLESVPNLSSPLESINRALLLIMKRQTRADEPVDPNLGSDYPLVFAHDANEFLYFLEALRNQGLLEMPIVAHDSPRRVMLTPRGWEKSLELKKTKRKSDQAFVAMWFEAKLNDAWEKGIKPALESNGFNPLRIDKTAFNDKIDDQIITEIRKSGLVVADFTGHREGVYFEAGFALGLGIPVIFTCAKSDIDKAHFDTRQYNHIVWDDAADLKSKLTFRITATIPNRNAI